MVGIFIQLFALYSVLCTLLSIICYLLASPKLLSLGIVKVNFFSALAYSQLSLYSVLCTLLSVICSLYSYFALPL